MANEVKNDMEALGPLKGVYRDISGHYPSIMENQMEKNMEHEMETGVDIISPLSLHFRWAQVQ